MGNVMTARVKHVPGYDVFVVAFGEATNGLEVPCSRSGQPDRDGGRLGWLLGLSVLAVETESPIRTSTWPMLPSWL
jgi:hypothetical protein